jgi:hypothetical protein
MLRNGIKILTPDHMKTCRFIVLLLFIACMLGCATTGSSGAQGFPVSTSSYVKMEKVGPTFCVYPATNDLSQVEFANRVEENILSIGGKVYDRSAKVRSIPPVSPARVAGTQEAIADNNSNSEIGDDDETGGPMGFGPGLPLAISVGKEIIPLLYKGADGKEKKESTAGIEKQAVTHDVAGNPSEYAIITYASNQNDPNEGRVRIINKSSGEVIANFRLDKHSSGIKAYQELFSDVFRVKYISGDRK